MKKLIVLLLTVTTVTAYAQQSRWQSVSYADPALSNLLLTDGGIASVNADILTIGTPVKLQFTAANKDPLNAVPAGTCQVKITLGSKFRLVNDLSVPGNLPLSDYFHWSIIQADRAAQYIIIGDLYNDLPPRFAGTVSFTLMPNREGSSTATCQLLISNHNNTSTILSDMTPSNNFLSKAYSNIKPVGAKFTQLEAKPHGCILELNWTIFDEEKVTRNYVIESSDDGINFQPLKTVTATALASYNLLLEGFSKSSMTIRIKAETQDGRFVYSGNVYVANICNTRFEAALYPNPVPADITEVSLQARSGIFNGKYSIVLTDAGGKELKRTEATFVNQLQVKYNTGFIASGAYYITITGEDGQTSGLKMVKQ
jgi:hypothetical protein